MANPAGNTAVVASAWLASVPEKIASSPKVRDVKVSPAGDRVLYQVQQFYRNSDHTKSEVWIAAVDAPATARKLFHGVYNDRSAIWHTDARSILFLSDRHGPGQPGQIFIARVDREGGTTEPELLMSRKWKYGISTFMVSPDGRYVAFTTMKDRVLDNQNFVNGTCDAKVFGARSTTSIIALYDFSSKEVIETKGLLEDDDEFIETFGWSPDSKEILYRVRKGAPAEYMETEVCLRRVQVSSEQGGTGPTTVVVVYPRSPSGKNVWLASGHVATLQSFEPRNVLDARALFLHPSGDSLPPGRPTRLYGETEDAINMVDASYQVGHQRKSIIAVEIAKGFDTRFDIITINDEQRVSVATLHQTRDEGVWFGAWDVRGVVGADGSTAFVFAAALSSVKRHEPPTVWALRIPLEDVGRKNTERVRLSPSHVSWLEKAPAFEMEVVEWHAPDGTPLSGLVRYPPGYRPSDGPRPTVLHIHGGPYKYDLAPTPKNVNNMILWYHSRDIPDYMPFFCNWRELLAWAGYIVISPMYRGSQGRGHKFAHAAMKGIGVYDWPDCESMVDHLVAKGVADPRRLGVAGWSHGGSLTAWGVTQTKNKFKAAVVGAGATNWEAMVAESVSPRLEAAIGQRDPWDRRNTEGVKPSPIHRTSSVETAVLILHGENDQNMPLGQAVGFFRGLRRNASERGKAGSQLVIYPREPHGFVEQGHIQDVLTRVVEHFRKYL